MSLMKLVRAPFIAALLAVAGLAVSLPTPALAQAASAPEATASAEAAPPVATAPVATLEPYGDSVRSGCNCSALGTTPATGTPDIWARTCSR